MLEILYEDAYIIIINKPNNILVHHSDMSRNMSDEKSMVEVLFDEYQHPFYPIHRLDRKTSGVIVFAKEKRYVTEFQDLFLSTTPEKESIQKIYLGLVRGFIDENGTIDSPVKGRDANVHKEAFTSYQRLHTFEFDIPVDPYATSRYSLVRLFPKTGRMHQLRIHMNKVNHPLIGDPKYGDRFHNRMFLKEFGSDRLFLHAQELIFTHPFTNKKLTIKATTPQHWNHFIPSS